MALAIVILVTGCQTTIRENIISTINTGFGATVAQNPQTELPEIKLGYIRSQYYSIPTSKQVKGGKHTGPNGTEEFSADGLSNDPSKTPELVSGIRAESDAKSLFLGVRISENFAVGKKAVMSPAAVAMYTSSAATEKAAIAAGEAAKAVANSPEFNDQQCREKERANAEGQIRKVWRSKPAAQDAILAKAKTLEVVNKVTTNKKNFLQRLSTFADDLSDEKLATLKELAEDAKKQP